MGLRPGEATQTLLPPPGHGGVGPSPPKGSHWPSSHSSLCGGIFPRASFQRQFFFLFHFYFLFFAFASACVTVPLQISGLKHCSFFLCLPRSSGLDVPGNRHCSVCLSQTLAENTVARNIIPFPAQSLILSRPTQRPNFAAALLPHVCQLLQVFVCNVAVESELWLGWALKGL